MDRLARMAGEFGLGAKTGIGVNPEAAGARADPLVVRAQVPRAVPDRVHAQRGDRSGGDERDAAPARPRVRRARQRGDALHAAARPLGGDERRRDRAGLSAARPAQGERPAGEPRARERRPLRRRERPEGDGVSGARRRARRRGEDRNRADRLRRRQGRGREDRRVQLAEPRVVRRVLAREGARRSPVVVLIEHGGSGPTVAAPLAMEIIRDYERIQAARAGRPLPKFAPRARSPGTRRTRGAH